jgi:hypothetical protein
MSLNNKAAWIFCAASFLVTPLLAVGCAQEATNQEEVGTLTMNLVATTADGDTFRLRGAQFAVSSGGFDADVLTTEDNPDATSLSSELPEGDYTVRLRAGWFMEKLVDGAYEVVDAQLQSPESVDVAIAEGVTTPVSYQFKAFGQQVAFGGTLEITTEVVEELCTDDLAEENDDLATAAAIDISSAYEATICPFDDDYYAFTAPSGFFSVRIDFSQDEGDLDLEVLDETGTVVAQSAGTTDIEGVDIDAFPTPTGFVRVLGFRAAGADYSLSFGSTPAAWTCDDNYFNDGECDCGCGAQEADCDPETTPGSCVTNNCPAEAPNVNPTNYAQCTDAPAGWTCNGTWYTDDHCDCGCGAPDADCDGLTLPEQCAFDTCGGNSNVDPADPTQCLP